MEKLYIKNMVCPRCIRSVEHILGNMNIEPTDIQLGKLILSRNLTGEEKSHLSKQLEQAGFSLLDDRSSQLVNEIKSIIIDEIHHATEPSTRNLSDILSEKLHYEYSHLSRLFSSVEGRTIEKFVIAQKVEKVKELLFYNQLNLEEISYRLHYSSAAHLSSQFKKVTGMSPSQFKKQHIQNRKSLDEI